MKKLINLFILVFLLQGHYCQSQEPFTSGNIVVYRIGDGSGLLTTAAAKIFLDEYTPAGVLVQSIELPSTGSKKITNLNNANGGWMTLSLDGKYLVVPGYNANPGFDLSGAGAD